MFSIVCFVDSVCISALEYFSDGFYFTSCVCKYAPLFFCCLSALSKCKLNICERLLQSTGSGPARRCLVP